MLGIIGNVENDVGKGHSMSDANTEHSLPDHRITRIGNAASMR
jgi:hypothetical protein